MSDHDLTTYEGAVAWVGFNYPLIASGLLSVDASSELGVLARQVYSAFVTKAGMDHNKIEAAMESFVEMSYEFVRLQGRFMKSLKYSAESAKEILEELYLNEERMNEYYLDGLLLTYSFWPNQVALLMYFKKNFLGTLPTEARLMEIGVGHGLMANILLRTLPSCHYTGLDISPSSLAYATHLWKTNGTNSSDTVLERADVTEWSTPDTTSVGLDAVICCEVLEHVENPGAVLCTIRDMLKTDGAAFITTVANVAAEDHIYLFSDADEIRALLRHEGLRVVNDQAWPLRGFEDEHVIPLNYAAVLHRAD
jgi:2-polyprenyl-3-methyl-5-hydroxy-6-metoxy-1,4-benzoquinol methylase